MDRSPIEVGRERRPMECDLTTEEQKQRSNQVHSELAQRGKEHAAQETLEAEAKAKREEAKAIEQRIAQRDLRIKALNEAAISGRETRDVDIVRYYDETKGEVYDVRADTSETIPLMRAPTAEEWDAINRQRQEPLKVGDTPIADLSEATIIASAKTIAARLRDNGEDAFVGVKDLLIYLRIEVLDEGKRAAIWTAFMEEYNLPVKEEKKKRKPRA